MFKKIGRHLIQGAKAEITENPPPIIDTEEISETLKTVALVGLAGLVLMGLFRKPSTIVVNVTNVLPK